jgi:hypothetical protein
VREKYCWLVADKPSEQGDDPAFLLGAAPFANFALFCVCV